MLVLIKNLQRNIFGQRSDLRRRGRREDHLIATTEFDRSFASNDSVDGHALFLDAFSQVRTRVIRVLLGQPAVEACTGIFLWNQRLSYSAWTGVCRLFGIWTRSSRIGSLLSARSHRPLHQRLLPQCLNRQCLNRPCLNLQRPNLRPSVLQKFHRQLLLHHSFASLQGSPQ